MGGNSFFQEFEYGASSEGYCTYERMVVNLSNAPKSLRLFILVLNSSIYLVIPESNIEEEKMFWR